jgi:hypothetical protein
MTNFNIKERLTDFKIIKAQYEKALKMLKLSPSRKKTAKRIVEN